MLRSAVAVQQIPVAFNVEDLKRTDEWQTENMGLPLAVGIVIDAHYNVNNAGVWRTLPDGQRIWQLTLHAENAVATMLYYSAFYIPEGGKLFIYNREKTHLLGAYTTLTNPSGRRFATEFVSGDELTLEYVAAPSGEEPRIEIEGIGYGYNNLAVRNGQIEFRVSACEVNVNCEEGDAWQNQKKGVCRMVQRVGSREYLCSASLVNNTAQDLKPYILTAYHCSLGSADAIASDENLEQWTFYFHHERSGCNDLFTVNTPKTMVGCRRVAASEVVGRSDGLLVLINEPIPENYNVYYNGWDNRDNAANSGVSIHHPFGDYKVISTFLTPVTNYTFESMDGLTGGQNAHWNVTFSATANGHGITENGSSGAPLFNENKLIVGTLTGGNSSCSYTEGRNLYGKMSYHWDKYKTADSTRMDIWLDPVRSGAQTLTGRYHAGVLPAPRNLMADYADKKVQLAWSAPASGIPTAYHVYNNNLRIGSTGSLTFEDDVPGHGDRTYSISAVYANGNESEFATRSIFIPEYKAPASVSAAITTSRQVAVSWQPPLYEQTIYWGEKAADSQVVLGKDASGNPRPFYFGQMWTASDIYPYHRKTLTAVKFLPVRNNTYEIYIEQGSRIYRQKVVNASYRETNTVVLTTPFVIDGNSRLIVAFYADRPTGYPACCDAGPAIRGKGNIYSYDGAAWSELYNPDDGFNDNFFIAAVVTSTEGDLPTTYSAAATDVITPAPGAQAARISIAAPAASVAPRSMTPTAFPEITGYNIYRNGTRIYTATVNVRRYIDAAELLHTMSYQVAVLYGNHESDLSEKVEISLQANEAVEAEPVALHPAVFTNRTEISGVDRITRIEIYAADGRRYMQLDHPDRIVDTQSLPVGICFFRIYTRDGACHTLRGVRTRR